MSRTSSRSEEYTDEKSYDAQKKRTIPYGSVLVEKWDISNFKRNSLLPYGGELATDRTDKNIYTYRSSLDYNTRINQHYFNAIAGFEVKSTNVEGVKDMNYGYLPERGKKFTAVTISEWESFAELNRKTSPIIVDNKVNILSYYGVFTYSFKDKYILNFNIRADGSNRFGKDKSTRFLPVWSVSGRYNLSDEECLKNLNWLDYLTFKSSYGVQGNVSPEQIPNLIITMGSLNEVAKEFSSSLYKVPNNNLKWEKTTSYNMGFDFGFFDGRFSGTLETYYKKGTDQIVSKQISPTCGVNKVAINDGTIINKGWELSLSGAIIRNKDLRWNLSINTSKNNNKITNAGTPLALTMNDYIEGKICRNGRPVNSFYSYKFNGLDRNGLPTFEDFNEKDEDGNMLVNSQSEAFDRIFEYSGKREADVTGGFSNYINYKGFSLNTIFAFSLGNKIRLNDLYKSSGQSLPFPQQNMSSEFVNRWKKAGDEEFTNIPSLSDDALLISTGSREYPIANNKWEMYNKSNLRVVDGSFLRCTNMTLGYSIKQKFCEKLHLKTLKISATVTNLFIIKDTALKGRDPEQLSFGAGSIPPQRQYSLRLSLNF